MWFSLWVILFYLAIAIGLAIWGFIQRRRANQLKNTNNYLSAKIEDVKMGLFWAFNKGHLSSVAHKELLERIGG